MSGFTHETPERIENHERWVFIFSRKAFIACLVAALPAGLIVKSLWSAGLPYLGFGIGLVLLALTYLVTSIKVPEGFELKGQGITIDVILLRILWRLLNRCLYVKNYEEKEEGR